MRPSKAPRSSIQLQQRDIAFLQGLFESRIMTIAHASAIHFEGHSEAAKKRILKLKRAGFVSERPRRVSEPSILFLSRAGIRLLDAQGILKLYPALSLPALQKRAYVSEQTLRHELSVMDVKAAFYSAARNHRNLSISKFSTWPQLHQFKVRHRQRGVVLVKPDGFIRIREANASGIEKVHVFFLEVDRSTESLDIITARLACYRDYYRSGGFAVRNGVSPTDYKRHPFRVLLVCKSEQRKETIVDTLLQFCPQILGQTCLSTMEEVTCVPLGEIWRRQARYRQAGVTADLSHGLLI